MGYEPGPKIPNRPYGNARRMPFTLDGKDYVSRSKCEATFAKLLEMLRGAERIIAASYEPRTFWFEGVRRGTVSYLPDFWAKWDDGEEVVYECKSSATDLKAKDITKYKRMAKYFPEVTLVLVLPRRPGKKAIKGKIMVGSAEKYVDHVWYLSDSK